MKQNGKRIQNILVLGMGKVGHLVAELLHKTGFSVFGADKHILHDSEFFSIELDVRNEFQVKDVLTRFDTVVSCLPFNFNRIIAAYARQLNVHYFDLTEDVATTEDIRKMSKNSISVMAPQCGLAPGFIAIAGASLINKFDRVRSLKLRVGALPRNPTGKIGYAFNWSPEGVVNEYLNDCTVIENGEIKVVSPMEWYEQLVIEGTLLEACTTSGGLGTMCETFLGKIENLDYKSIRYPGHFKQMNIFFHELRMCEDRELAGKILTNAKPPVSDDLVYIHASAEGWKDGRLSREEFVRTYYPMTIGDTERTAISWTTASSVCAVVEMVAEGLLPSRGFLKQESIPLSSFLKTENGRRFLK